MTSQPHQSGHPTARQDQAIYYDGPHSGHVLTHEQGREDAAYWADYINVGMEHGAFDMTGLEAYMRGLVEGGPTPPATAPRRDRRGAGKRHRRAMCAPTPGSSPDPRPRRARHPAVPGRTADAVRAFVESCRYPHNSIGVDPICRRRGADARRNPPSAAAPSCRPPMAGHRHARARSETTAAPIWGLSGEEYMARCDPWPLNPKGELLLGVKLESPEGVANGEAICAVPGLGFAEIGPGDLSLSLGSAIRGIRTRRRCRRRATSISPRAKSNGSRSCRAARGQHRARIDEGVRVIAGHKREPRIGRAHQRRTMAV